MLSGLLWCAGVAGPAAGAIRLYHARGQRTTGATYLSAALICAGLAAGTAAPATLIHAAAVEPFPNATRLISSACGMGAAFCVHGLVTHLAVPEQHARTSMRRHAIVLAIAITAMIVLLAAADVAFHPNFVDAHADEAPVAAYTVIFGSYIGYAAAAFLGRIRDQLRRAQRPWLIRGLILVQLGAVCGISWAVVKCASALWLYTTQTTTGLEGPLTAALSAACVVCIAVGSSMPAWGPRLAAPAYRLRQYYHYRDLHPLAAAVSPVLPAPPLPTEADDGTLTWRLARRLAHIRDGLLVLAPYRSNHTATQAYETARRRGEDNPNAVAEAADIAAALHQWETDHAPEHTEPPVPTHNPPLPDEIPWLRRVAQAYQRSATVAEHRHGTHHPHG